MPNGPAIDVSVYTGHSRRNSKMIKWRVPCREADTHTINVIDHHYIFRIMRAGTHQRRVWKRSIHMVLKQKAHLTCKQAWKAYGQTQDAQFKAIISINNQQKATKAHIFLPLMLELLLWRACMWYYYFSELSKGSLSSGHAKLRRALVHVAMRPWGRRKDCWLIGGNVGLGLKLSIHSYIL
jgi:hypothetical protein